MRVSRAGLPAEEDQLYLFLVVDNGVASTTTSCTQQLWPLSKKIRQVPIWEAGRVNKGG